MPSRPVKLTPRFRARYPATESSVSVIGGEVEAIARECGLEGEELADVRLAVSEAARDAVLHGSAGRGNADIHLRVDLTDVAMRVVVGDDSCEMTFPNPAVRRLKHAAAHVHAGAVERLERALADQGRLSDQFDAAVGTSTEFGAYARLQRAGEQVTASQAWVHWIESEYYRGINAGPFELRAESETTDLTA